MTIKKNDRVKITNKECNHYGSTGVVISAPHKGFLWVSINDLAYMLHRNEVEVINNDE